MVFKEEFLNNTKILYSNIFSTLFLTTTDDDRSVVVIGGNPVFPLTKVSSTYFKGNIADFAIFDRVLSAIEVQSIFDDPNGLQGMPSQTDHPTITPSFTPTITLPEIGEWYINKNGAATEEFISGDTILVSLSFNTSNRDHGASVYAEDCVTPFDSNNYFDVYTSNPSSNDPDGFIQFNTILKMNITALNGTGYWKPFTDGNRGGWFQACVQTYLNFTDMSTLGCANSEQKVNFTNTLLNISLSLASEFTSEKNGNEIQKLDVTEEDVDTDYSDEITVFECEDPDPYTQLTGRTYRQGENIMICATTTDTNLVQVEEFNNILVSQGGTPYNYIKNGLYNPEITTPVCLDGTGSNQGRVCYAKLVLLARFFPDNNPNDLTISGSVFVIRDGQRLRRNLQMSLSSPDMKKRKETGSLVAGSARRINESKEGRGDFSLAVRLQPSIVYVYSDASINYGIGTRGMVFMAVGAAGAALMAY